MYFLENLLLYSEAWFTNGNSEVKSVKLVYFFENLLLYSEAYIRQTKCIIVMTKEVSTKIVNFVTPGTGVLVLGRGHISHI